MPLAASLAAGAYSASYKVGPQVSLHARRPNASQHTDQVHERRQMFLNPCVSQNMRLSGLLYVSQFTTSSLVTTSSLARGDRLLTVWHTPAHARTRASS